MSGDIEISHDDHVSRVGEYSKASAEQPVEHVKKRGLVCRLCRCLICLPVLLVLGVAIVLVALWQTGRFDKDPYVFTASSDGHKCNGLASNCGWKVNEIMFPSLHNAMSSRDDAFVKWNHILPLEAALEAGFRGLFLDTCQCSVVGVTFCHDVCAGGYRKITPVFSSILTFLTLNPNEVVIVELQVGGKTLTQVIDEASQITGYSDIIYKHSGRYVEWPTMQELIDTNKRLIIFQHDGGDCENAGECPTGITDTYSNAFETPYDSVGLTGLMNFTTTCKITRGDYRNAFFISNHFAGDEYQLPSYDVAVEANKAENLIARLDACHEIVGRRVNLLAVDFWSIGDVLAVVTAYNEALGVAPTSEPSSEPSISPSMALT